LRAERCRQRPLVIKVVIHDSASLSINA
jgi:hypothetical protein